MALAAVLSGAAEGHTLVDRDVLADLRGLTDDHTHAVVDEEPGTDGGAGVDLDAGDEPGCLTHHAGGQAPVARVQAMGRTVHPDGMQAGVREDHLGVRPRGGIALAGGVEVAPERGGES